MSKNNNKEIYDTWKSLINMSSKELSSFMKSDDGKDAGLTKKQAEDKGISNGHQSANMLLKMIPSGKSYSDAEKNWTDDMWRWAKKQNSFNSRMLGMKSKIKGNPYKEKNGDMTRWLKSLLIWGHDPRKK